MKLPLQIVFRNMDPSDAIEANVRERAEKLEHFSKDIMSCRVVVEAHHKHHHKGNLYHVRVDVKVPGRELVVSREPGKHQAHEDVYVAIRDSFNAMGRQLEDHMRRIRGKVKTHEVTPHGSIIEIVSEDDSGVIQSSDGREIYFHRNSVVDGNFDHLKVGDKVHFTEIMDESGPKATTVYVEGKHHVVGKPC